MFMIYLIPYHFHSKPYYGLLHPLYRCSQIVILQITGLVHS